MQAKQKNLDIKFEEEEENEKSPVTEHLLNISHNIKQRNF